MILVAGCGGDTRRAGQAPVQPPTATPAQAAAPAGPLVAARVTDPERRAYIARIDRICSRFDPARNRAREDASGDVAEVARRYDESIAVGARELREIEAVRPPHGDSAALRANVFDVIARQLELRRRIHVALVAREAGTVTALQAQLDALSHSLVGFARGYGFTICGTD